MQVDRPSPRSAAAIALTVFGLGLVGAAIVPRPPGPPDDSPGTPVGAALALVGFAVVGAGAIYAAVARLPGRAQRAPARRMRRSLGALAVYVGLVILLTGLVAQRSWTEHAVSLRPGGATELTDPFGHRWRFVSQGVSRDERMNYLSTGVALEAWRDGRRAGIISAERRQYLDGMQRPTFEPAPKPGIRSTPALDVYVVLAEIRGEAAQMRVGFRPLVASVWVGWLLIAVGGLAVGVTSTERTATAG